MCESSGDNTMNFIGKVVLITGASSGIGAATAVHFAKLGASVALTGRNIENLQAVGEKCKNIGKCEPLLVRGDLDNEQDVQKVILSFVYH